MSYFVNGNEKLYIGVSNDGKQWSSISSIEGLYTPVSTTLRDPSIVEQNNTYFISHTTNISATDGFSIIKSDDLVNWDSVAYVDCSSITVPASQVWAPELYLQGDTLFAFVSISNVSGDFQLYSVYSTDSEHIVWSMPLLVTGNFPSNIIDGFPIKVNDTYYMFYKDENDKYIELASSSNLTSGYAVIDSNDWAGWGNYIEEVSVVKTTGSTYRIYFNVYDSTGTIFNIYWSESSDVFANWTTKKKIISVDKNIQHPTVLKTNNIKTFKDAMIPVASKDYEPFPYYKLTTYPYDQYNSWSWYPNSNSQVFRFYVKPSGDDGNDGLTWNTAKREISSVLTELPNNLRDYQVWILVAPGVYSPIDLSNKKNGDFRFEWLSKEVDENTSDFYTWVKEGNGGQSLGLGTDSIVIRSTTSDIPFNYVLSDNAKGLCNVIFYSFARDGHWASGDGCYANRWIFENAGTAPYVMRVWGSDQYLEFFQPVQFNMGASSNAGLDIDCRFSIRGLSFYGGSGEASRNTSWFSGKAAFVIHNWADEASGVFNDDAVFAAGYEPPSNASYYFQDLYFATTNSFRPNKNVSWEAVSKDQFVYVQDTSSIAKATVDLTDPCYSYTVYDSRYFNLDDHSTTTTKTIKELNVGTITRTEIIKNLPTSDPGISGALWNNAGVINVSP